MSFLPYDFLMMPFTTVEVECCFGASLPASKISALPPSKQGALQVWYSLTRRANRR